MSENLSDEKRKAIVLRVRRLAHLVRHLNAFAPVSVDTVNHKQ